ncbi:hypothetical protein [Deminuibacter soli]|uniref:Muconolactone isomerase domain-containing protein n=1 Tax=Deminuibacter soli TaxID=2291815 RepID=A0A3E1NIH6_9BACT|nr:hypothetical protein [Deminuibacter soli]RFM27733.1 hypothetical protein DXN05_13595 [Deminuibacter soli]
MKRFQAIVHFEMDKDFMSLLPPHRTYINYLINKQVIDSYAVSMESQTVWITINALSKADADQYLAKSPLYPYWRYEIEELQIYDGQVFRMPTLQMN